MTKLGESLIQAAKEALAHARGELDLPERIVFPLFAGKYKHRDLPPDPEEYPGTLIPFYDVLEAEPEQHPPPKRKVEGSTPSEDSN